MPWVWVWVWVSDRPTHTHTHEVPIPTTHVGYPYPCYRLAAYDWLQSSDDILSLVVTAFSLTCGIPPREFQFANMQYDHCPTTGSFRNLFIINGLPALGNPTAKQSNKLVQKCLWLFPPSLAPLFLFYLGVLRPITIEVLIFLRQNVAYQETHIFCHTIKKHCVWNGSDVNGAIQHYMSALPIRLTCKFLRQLHTALFHQYCPGLCKAEGPSDSAVDHQGQHRWYTGNTHYGRIIGSVPKTLGMSMTEARQFATVSQLLQVIYGLCLPDESSKDLLLDAHILPCSKYETHAYLVAQKLVIQHYGILSGDVAASVATVLNNRPYIQLVRMFNLIDSCC